MMLVTYNFPLLHFVSASFYLPLTPFLLYLPPPSLTTLLSLPSPYMYLATLWTLNKHMSTSVYAGSVYM